MLIKWVDFGGTTYTVDDVKTVANHGVLDKYVAQVIAQHYDGDDGVLIPRGGPIVSPFGAIPSSLDSDPEPVDDDETLFVTTIDVDDADGQRFTVTSDSRHASGLYLVIEFRNGGRQHWFMNAMSAYLMSETGATVDRLHP